MYIKTEKMFDYKYLSKEHLEGFDSYKYMAIDNSPLSVYVMHPFWNKVVEYVPRWVAPNVLTFTGFLFTVLDFVLLSYYDYNYTAASANSTHVDAAGSTSLNGYTEVIPRSLWFFLAVFHFVAYTLDGIDGKQARRTQTSGPLGELFDHGLDSYSIFFIPACLYSVFGRYDFSISSLRMYYLMWNILLNFYLSHWEKYNTGVLYLPWGYDVGMWAATMFFIWTGLYGTGFYKRYLFAGFSLADAFEVVIYATGVFTTLPVSIYNVWKSYKMRTGKMRPIGEAIRPLWSVSAVAAILTLWVHGSPTLLQYDLRAFMLLLGTVFSNVACRLIVSQMSGTRCQLGNWITIPLLVSTVVSLTMPRLEPVALYLAVGIALLAHIHYGACVVRQMCAHFRLSCFHIKERSD